MAMAWLRALRLTLPIAAKYGLENTWGKGKIKLYTCACKRPVEDDEESATLVALTMEGD